MKTPFRCSPLWPAAVAWALLAFAPATHTNAAHATGDPLEEPAFYSSPLSPELIAKAQDDERFTQLNLRGPSDPSNGGLSENGIGEGRWLRLGMVLTPYQRVALCAEAVLGPCPLDVVERIARPELWIVAIPYSRDRARALVGEETTWDSNPRVALDHYRIPRSARIFWPETITLRTDARPRRMIKPLWEKREDFPFSAGLAGEWLPGKSIVAAFPLDDPAIKGRGATILFEGNLEQDGRLSPRETETFALVGLSGHTWKKALRGEVRKPRKKRDRG